MGEVADERVFRLVKELCASVPVVNQEMANEALFDKVELCASVPVVKQEMANEASFDKVELCASVPAVKQEMANEASFDKVLAELFDMGFDIELASRAIFDCGRLDVPAIIDHMNSEAPTSTAVAMDSSVVPAGHHSSLPLSHMKVKLQEERQHMSNRATGSSQPRRSTFEASTSRAHSSEEDQDGLYEWDEDLTPSKQSMRSSGPLDSTVKGKLPMAAATEDGEDAVDSDRWEYDQDDDDPGTDKEAYLLRMGFCQKDVTDALEACGENSDVNHLANHIMNGIVDLPDSKWEDDDPVGDDLVDEEGPTKFNKDDLRVWPSEELADRGVLILKKLQSIGVSSSVKVVFEAIQARGKDAADDDIVDYVLASDERTQHEGEDIPLPLSKLELLKDLGCTSTAACLRAIDNNRDADIDELLDYIQAEEINDKFAEEDALGEHVRDLNAPAKRRKKSPSGKPISPLQSTPSSQKKWLKRERRGDIAADDEEEDDDDRQVIRRNMKGFGLPGEPVIPRVLSEDIARPPYFYFENVALTPKDEWKNIQRHLYNIPPEFVDSLNFSPCRRPRGYVHNLPVQGRVNVLPRPPMSVQELIPGSAKYWPTWDPRVKLNTINTRTASEFVRRQIQESLNAVERGDTSRKDVKTILFWARKWNLVWQKENELGPMSPEQIERCLGFDVHHTQVLYSSCDKFRVLGNSFQVNTVAYHLSVLLPLYRSGIRVLSLFSGIGGAEVALHKLGIFLKVVVSVEIDDKARMVMESWWKTTNQKGRLIHSFKDVKELDLKAVQKLVDEFGGFDLVIGGSPCNNLSGNNRCSRTGLAGPASVTFFEFPRILADVRDYMALKRR